MISVSVCIVPHVLDGGDRTGWAGQQSLSYLPANSQPIRNIYSYDSNVVNSTAVFTYVFTFGVVAFITDKTKAVCSRYLQYVDNNQLA